MPRVIVLYSPAPRQVLEWPVEVAEGSTVREALLASGWPAVCPGLDVEQADVGIWGKRCTPQQPLHEGDRVEVYRGLLVDPKVARRQRFKSQGARAAGLFARKRPGAKPGY
jgi:putative ubiquitin-RnfH superfamily antitoxin RatB of RatAB toxin-antitoxin module